MNDVVFTEAELSALRHHALRQAWVNADDKALSTDAWLALSEKLAEAARQASAVQAAHRAYISHLNARQAADDAARRSHEAHR